MEEEIEGQMKNDELRIDKNLGLEVNVEVKGVER